MSVCELGLGDADVSHSQHGGGCGLLRALISNNFCQFLGLSKDFGAWKGKLLDSLERLR